MSAGNSINAKQATNRLNPNWYANLTIVHINYSAYISEKKWQKLKPVPETPQKGKATFDLMRQEMKKELGRDERRGKGNLEIKYNK